MWETLFEIPYQVGGVPLFGMGVLLAVWAVVTVVVLVGTVRRHGLDGDTLSTAVLLLLIGAGILLVPKVFPGGLPIRGYGFMLLVAVVCGVALAVHRARQMGVHPDVIFSLAFWMFVGGIVGARAFYVIEYWENFRRETLGATLLALLNVLEGGLVVYGSLIGGVAVFLWVTWRRKLPALALADLIAPALLLGLALGRIGCLMHGCCYGGPCAAPWAVTFPPDSPPYYSQVVRGEMHGFRITGNASGEPIVLEVMPDSPAARAGLEPGMRIEAIDGQPVTEAGQVFSLVAEAYNRGAPLVLQTDRGTLTLSAAAVRTRSLAVHPTQVYSAVGAVLLCLFLLAYYPFRRRDGEVTAWMLTLYPVGRFLIEVIRTDEPAIGGTGLSISQNVSLAVLVAAGALWLYLARQPRGSILPLRGRTSP